MKITFLLGNGFDLQCGLKTSYTDFYEYIFENKYGIKLTQQEDETALSRIDNIIYSEIYKSRDRIDTWADLELQLGKLTNKISNDSNGDRQFSNRFLDDFESLRTDLNDYLKKVQIQEETKITDDFSDKLLLTMDKFFEGLLEKEYDELKKMLNENIHSTFEYSVVSFNYTNTLKKIFNHCRKTEKVNGFVSSSYYQKFNSNIINVHGVIDRFLTLGVNDETQLATDLFDEEDLVDLLKPNSLEDTREYRRRDAENYIKNSDIVVIFGMSMGVTDIYWWEKVATVIINDKNKKLIIHSYEENPSFLSSREVRLRRKKKEDEFISRLTNLDLSDETISQLRNQMYIVTNSPYIFNVDLTKYLGNLESKVALNEKNLNN